LILIESSIVLNLGKFATILCIITGLNLVNFISLEMMNESSLENSISRHSKKRKSYEVIKSSNCAKNGKKSLP
jgi:hypothetical protein